MALLHRADPSFLIDVTPTAEVGMASILLRFCREQEKLHPFFSNLDLGHRMALVVIENAVANRAKASELWRHIKMLEPMFHEKQIRQFARICLDWLKLRDASRT